MSKFTVPKGYAPVPFWFWNDELDKKEIVRQIGLMDGAGIEEFIIHARVGLATPYLSEEWFSCVEAALAEAARRGMGVWLYDEENFPSGYAGGRVLAELPEAYGKHLKMLPDGSFTVCKTLWKAAYTDSLYIDVLNRAATECFLNCVHREYHRRFSAYFGNTVKGFFLDEPGFYNNIHYYAETNDNDTVVWTDDFREQFLSRRGYDVWPKLIHVFRNVNASSAQVREDFFTTAGELYRERFLQPVKDYAESVGVKSIGHLHMEDYLHFQIGTQGDFTQAMDCLSYAGLDRIDENTEKHTEKLVSSLAHIYGKPRTMSESFALGGWGLDFTRMKRTVDYQYVRGVNMLVPHAFFYSVRGDRKRDAPPSQFFQNGYFKYYGEFARYVASLSYLLTRGEYVEETAVYYPMETAYSRYTPEDFTCCMELDKKLQQVSFGLLALHRDFFWINAERLLNGDLPHVKVLLIPFAEKLSASLTERIRPLSARIKVILLGCGKPVTEELPGAVSLPEQALYKSYTYAYNEAVLEKLIASASPPRVREIPKEIKTMRREADGQAVWFLTNEQDVPRCIRPVFSESGTPYLLDCTTREAVPLAWRETAGSKRVALHLSSYGSAVVVFARGDAALSAAPSDVRIREIPAADIALALGDRNFTGTGLWEELGMPEFSGSGVYRFSFEAENCRKTYLYAEEVCGTLEIWVNGRHAGDRVFPPFGLEITELIRSGANECELIVTNTVSYEMEGNTYPSGIGGSIRILTM